MWYVYAIFSEGSRRIYVGMTSNPNGRLHAHNSGQVKSTKGYIPWKRFYLVQCSSSTKAREIEKKLKSGMGKAYLKTILDTKFPR